MKNILDKETIKNTFERIDALKLEDKAVWGKMNAHESVCHMTDQLRLVEGTKECSIMNNGFKGEILKHLILWGMPAPKGKVETFKEIKQGAGGTKPVDFSKDKEELKRLISKFPDFFNSKAIVVHPAFGKMNKSQWARLAFIHLNHHLMQFGR